ncbi:hypothetical protein C2S52_001551 [Perilla frutescens var. hirtella]|nr:hypothetical protein C2S52_001551 [Perilla frutescens var. hirtella]
MALEASKRWLILAIMILVGAAFAYAVTLFDCQIILLNDSQNQTLVAGCKSNGADIGTLTIPPTRKKDFLSHVLVRERSFATCSMTLGNLHGTFDIFDWDRDKNKCKDKVCIWRITEAGLSLMINNVFVFQFKWP